jgi:hypothetical protein
MGVLKIERKWDLKGLCFLSCLIKHIPALYLSREKNAECAHVYSRIW